MRLLLIIVSIVILVGCSTTRLHVLSEPEGAYITELETGIAGGMTPLLLEYEIDGCMQMRGVKAQWPSGAVANSEHEIQLCNGQEYTLLLRRPQNYPGLEKDIQYALQIQAIRAQQQQANASLAAAYYAIYNNANAANSSQGGYSSSSQGGYSSSSSTSFDNSLTSDVYEQQKYGYKGISGKRYQYDLSKPIDQIRYEIDPAAQLRDDMNVDPRVDLDESMDNYGGGVER